METTGISSSHWPRGPCRKALVLDGSFVPDFVLFSLAGEMVRPETVSPK
jgi:hypothetical protein